MVSDFQEVPVDIDDELLEQLKHVARQRGKSIEAMAAELLGNGFANLLRVSNRPYVGPVTLALVPTRH